MHEKSNFIVEIVEKREKSHLMRTPANLKGKDNKKKNVDETVYFLISLLEGKLGVPRLTKEK